MKWHIRHPASTVTAPRTYCGGEPDMSDFGEHPGFPTMASMDIIGKPSSLPLCKRCLSVLKKQKTDPAPF